MQRCSGHVFSRSPGSIQSHFAREWATRTPADQWSCSEGFPFDDSASGVFHPSGDVLFKAFNVWIPNIAGEATMENLYGLVNTSATLTGVFSLGRSTKNAPSGNTGSTAYALSFDASDGDDTYSGVSLQVPALQCLCCIKS